MNLCKKCEKRWECLEELGIKRKTECSDFTEIVKEDDLPFSNKDENTFNESARFSSPFYNTVEGMLSPDYKERFKAEYRQTKLRYDKLHAMIVKADAGKLEFTPTCPLKLLRDQKACMGKYLYHLEVRAQIEGIEL